MAVIVKSTQVQQNFGQVMDKAFTEDDIVVERYGEPHVAILNYRRYQHLIAAEKELLRAQLQEVSAAVSARAAHLSDEEVEALIEQAREDVENEKRR
jgi:PHD/YefM family antitoxin component YafN of YafNO toxin-antitoxin module